jgi:hypothetical protein
MRLKDRELLDGSKVWPACSFSVNLNQPQLTAGWVTQSDR